MKSRQIILAALIGFVLGALSGWYLATLRAQVAILSGPYSDNYGPAHSAITEAKAKLQTGDTNVFEQLSAAELQIEHAQRWTKRFLGEQVGPTNVNQPFR